MSKSCTNCSAEIPQGGRFCDNCGMPVSEAEPPREGPEQKASAQPARTPLVVEGTPERRSQLGQSARLHSSPATLSDSATDQDQNRGERRRGVSRWVIRGAGFVGAAATGLMGVAAFWRRGADALAQSPSGNSATQQSMGVAEAPVKDPVPVDQSEANPEAVDKIAPTVTTEPAVTDAIVQDPAPIDRIEQNPGVIHDLVGSTPPVGAEDQPPPFGVEGQQSPPIGTEGQQSPPVGTEGQQSPPVGTEGQQPPPGDYQVPLGAEDLYANNPDLFDPNAPGPTVDPALLDPAAPGPTIHPNLLDPIAPGPTLDPALLDPAAPGATIDPNLLDKFAPGPTIHPGQIERVVLKPGVIEVTDTGTSAHHLHDPILVEPGVTESHTVDHDVHDHLDA